MIKLNIEKPDNCRECPLRSDMGNYCMPLLGKLLKNDIYTTRADFCPIEDDVETERMNNYAD